MNEKLACISKGPAERWARIITLVEEAIQARRDGIGAHSHDEEISAVKSEQRAADDLISELDQLAQQGVLEEIGNCLSVVYGRVEAI